MPSSVDLCIPAGPGAHSLEIHARQGTITRADCLTSSRDGTGAKAIDFFYFDLETQRTFDEVGGRDNTRMLRLAAAVTYSTATGSYHRYTEGRVIELVRELRDADLVVGYNVLEFDYEVLRGYVDFPFEHLPTLDMMLHLAERLHFRPSLESVATASLGIGKSADGLQAVRWYRQGLIDKVLDYCQQDVKVTRQVHEFGRRNKFVYYWDRQYQRQMVPVSW